MKLHYVLWWLNGSYIVKWNVFAFFLQLYSHRLCLLVMVCYSDGGYSIMQKKDIKLLHRISMLLKPSPTWL